MAVNDLSVVPFCYLVEILQPNLKSIEDTTMNTFFKEGFEVLL